jgi:hypothetical protein
VVLEDDVEGLQVLSGAEAERVYLHAGAARGAKALGIEGRDSITPSELPAAFRRLRAYEMEDCLCIFKDDLERLSRSSSVSS